MLEEIRNLKVELAAIPNSRWTVGHLINDGKRCVLGHCGLTHFTAPELVPRRVLWLNRWFASYLSPHTPVSVNDFRSFDFPQRKPKARVLAALTKIEQAYIQEQGIKEEKPKKVKKYRYRWFQFWRKEHAHYTLEQSRILRPTYTE
jgi:hypothetical protein